jgi:hypothetical protein
MLGKDGSENLGIDAAKTVRQITDISTVKVEANSSNCNVKGVFVGDA